MAPSPAELMRQEAGALGELAELHRDPVFRGRDLPRGDGRLVLVVPGLFGNDLYLQPLHGWLRRLGYTPITSSLVVNAGCPNRLRGQVEAALRRRMRLRPGPVALVGHSRGGMLAWAIASRLAPEASHLALLGSPAAATVAMFRRGLGVPGAVAASPVAAAGQRALKLLDPDCNVPDCGCEYPEDLRRPLDQATAVLSVRSRDDAIVPPSACTVAGAANLEVGGTHSGLVYNRAVYPALAAFLATRDGAGGESVR